VFRTSYQLLFKGEILDSRSSSKPGNRVKRSERSNSNSVGQLEESTLGESMTGELPPISGRQERRQGHQMISTATYYRTERRSSYGYGHDEADDWVVGDADSDNGLTEGDA
jgi:hypothetical protein